MAFEVQPAGSRKESDARLGAPRSRPSISSDQPRWRGRSSVASGGRTIKIVLSSLEWFKAGTPHSRREVRTTTRSARPRERVRTAIASRATTERWRSFTSNAWSLLP